MGIAGEIQSLIGELAERMKGYYRVIHFDNRGSGRTEKPDMAYSIGMMADDTAGLMDAIGIQHAHVLGISTGSRIALALPLHPDTMRDLILNVAAARSPDREDPAAAFERLLNRKMIPFWVYAEIQSFYQKRQKFSKMRSPGEIHYKALRAF